ncbi:hypothetical protein N7540_012118 [Penicillium herquei]|nr:hypothetical protein N7540_012118 [Penicillium herquei]
MLRATWQSLVNTNKPKPVSQLESLTVPCPSSAISGAVLFKLAAAADLSQLHTLDIGWIPHPESLAKIGRLFPNLRRLFINLIFRNPHTVGKTDVEELIIGILAFHPLKYLYIKGLRSAKNFDRIIQHHGPLLKGLSLVPFTSRAHGYPRLNPSEVYEIAIHCPNLEELHFQVTRSGGNQAECEMYKAFGHFHNLQTLFLDLEIDARPNIPSMGRRPVTEDFEVLRQTFINAAIDENLALQISSIIKRNNSNLKDLRLLPIGNQSFAPDESYLLFRFTRSYLLTHYNLETPRLPVIQQIGKRAWEVKRAKGETIAPDVIRDGELILSDGVVSVLQKIWP